MRKGSSILVQGPLKTDRWEDSTGVKRQRTYIIVQRVVFGSKRGREPGEEDESDKWPYPQPEKSAAGGTPAPVDDDVPC